MFKKNPKKLQVSITDSHQVSIYKGAFLDLPILEKVIIEKSIHFYDDPEPCFIHRGAIRNRLLAEMEQEINKASKKIIDSSIANFPLVMTYCGFSLDAKITLY